jgi:DNA-binding response OmpR family regulator
VARLLLTEVSPDEDIVSTKKQFIAAVNDDATFLHLLDTLLEREGYERLLLQAGQIAYETIKDKQPALVIIDIDIERPQNSWRLVELLTLDPETTNIPFILCVVASQELHQRITRFNTQNTRIIEKPFRIDELLEHIEQLMD